MEKTHLDASEMCVSVCVLQKRVARLEQLEKELQEARGSQESQLQVRYTVHSNTHTAVFESTGYLCIKCVSDEFCRRFNWMQRCHMATIRAVIGQLRLLVSDAGGFFFLWVTNSRNV